ncbi:cyclic nucleotide-binding protein [Thermanaerovibrio velox DSM 12556]|uniref:Cyclic nucleotide-binding protein n=1 Tax=Thermanaerovibrio velox DSM 12556 TaxID=926567 RepID=H0UNY4_9BACT|nr:Crp/Fnr family transcriptional regulator [Thermanaerovibrio velox]EHM10487.1 cyclic nucleotide-binding protein [Thermanaerovibrio velox DSM 12556]
MGGYIYSDLFDQRSQEVMRRFFLEEVAPLGIIRDYRRGSSVDHESATRSMGVVVKGCISKSMVSAGGKEKLLYFLRPGEIFGEMDLLDGGSFPYVLCARMKSSVAYVPLCEVESLLASRPESYRLFIHSMTRKFRIAALQLANSVFNDAGGEGGGGAAQAMFLLGSIRGWWHGRIGDSAGAGVQHRMFKGHRGKGSKEVRAGRGGGAEG